MTRSAARVRASRRRSLRETRGGRDEKRREVSALSARRRPNAELDATLTANRLAPQGCQSIGFGQGSLENRVPTTVVSSG